MVLSLLLVCAQLILPAHGHAADLDQQTDVHQCDICLQGQSIDSNASTSIFNDGLNSKGIAFLAATLTRPVVFSPLAYASRAPPIVSLSYTF